MAGLFGFWWGCLAMGLLFDWGAARAGSLCWCRLYSTWWRRGAVDDWGFLVAIVRSSRLGLSGSKSAIIDRGLFVVAVVRRVGLGLRRRVAIVGFVCLHVRLAH